MALKQSVRDAINSWQRWQWHRSKRTPYADESVRERESHANSLLSRHMHITWEFYFGLLRFSAMISRQACLIHLFCCALFFSLLFAVRCRLGLHTHRVLIYIKIADEWNDTFLFYCHSLIWRIRTSIVRTLNIVHKCVLKSVRDSSPHQEIQCVRGRSGENERKLFATADYIIADGPVHYIFPAHCSIGKSYLADKRSQNFTSRIANSLKFFGRKYDRENYAKEWTLRTVGDDATFTENVVTGDAAVFAFRLPFLIQAKQFVAYKSWVLWHRLIMDTSTGPPHHVTAFPVTLK